MSNLFSSTRTNRIARVLVGAAVGIFIYRGIIGAREEAPSAQPAQAALIQAAEAKLVAPQVKLNTSDRLVELARTDQIALLRWALANYEKHIQDYRLTFYKQERINGKLKSVEKIAILYKDEPHSVLMQWQENAGPIDKLLFVEGANENKMIVHPTGMLAWIKSVKRDPSGEEARRSSRGTCDQFGFRRTLENLVRVYELAQEQGDLKTAYLGETTVEGRSCVAIERRLPPKEQYPNGRMVLEFDKEYLLPIAISSYDWQDNLLSRYVSVDLKFNTGLTAGSFSPGANNL